MKRFLLVTLSILLLLTLLGCETGNNGDSNDDKLKSNDELYLKANDELYLKAIDILDEFNGDQRIKDFRNAYDLLMTLPSNEDDFISQLSEVNKIYEKYDVEFSGDYYLRPKHTIGIDQEGINKYRTQRAYYDATNLMESIVYPVLFEKYGDGAQSIYGITAQDVISTIKYTYTLDKQTELYDGYKEEWKSKTTPQLKYELSYHSNGLVERITVPFFMSDHPLNDNEFADFFEKDLAEQKKFASERFQNMLDEIDEDFLEYQILSQIFSDEEILVIINYIQSLTVEEIWEKNFYNYETDSTPNNYSAAAVYFDYNSVRVGVILGLNRITLNLSSKDSVNSLSTNWFTLWCGMCFPEGDSRNEIIDGYMDILNNNVEANSFVPDWSFDLNANAHKYQDSSSDNNVPPANDNKEETLNNKPFFTHNSFSSNNGNRLYVMYQEDIYMFFIEGELIGTDDTWVATQNSTLFEVDADNGTYLIFCYPNDEYVSVEVCGFLDTSLNGNYYP